MFWVIFILIFVGLALQDSGARMSRQVGFLREGVEDQLILEKAKGEEGLTREQIESVLLFRTILFSCSFSHCISCRLFVLLQVMCSFLCSDDLIKRPHGAAIILNPYHAANNLSNDC